MAKRPVSPCRHLVSSLDWLSLIGPSCDARAPAIDGKVGGVGGGCLVSVKSAPVSSPDARHGKQL